MIKDRDNVEVISTLKGERIQMKIADDALAHIMDMLTEAYEDAELAIIREYSTNALDAHVEAGVKRPIEITIPNPHTVIPAEMFLKVKDYGNGLSIQDVHNIYSQYGKTTKNESNDFVGSLGIGCKSALAYTSQFTFTSVKNGVRCQVIVSRDEEGLASMTVVDTSVTDEPSGVEIIVPLKRYNGVYAKAYDFFKYWEKGTVLVNGEDPTGIEGLQVSPDIILVNDSSNDHRIVMGNIPYPANFDSHDIGLPDNYSIVAYVDIGDVYFTPSREGLKYNSNKTKATMAKIVQEVVSGLALAIQKDIETASSNYEAIERYVHWSKRASKIVRDLVLNYNGVSLPSSIHSRTYSVVTDVKDESGNNLAEIKHERILFTNGGTFDKGHAHRVNAIDISFIPNCIFVYGYNKEKFSYYHKRKMHQWCMNNNLKFPGHFALTKSKLDTTWISEDKMVDWEEISAVKLPRANYSNGTGRRAARGTYDCYVDGQAKEDHPADSINTNKPVYYYVGNIDCAHSYKLVLDKTIGKYTLVCLYSNRANKFCRDFPMGIEIYKACQEFVKAWEATIEQDDITALYIQTNGRHKQLRHLEPGRIDDPEMYLAVSLARRNLDTLKDELNIYRMLGTRINPYGSVEWKNPLDKYPLINYHYSSLSENKEDIYMYINAKYEAQKGKVD